MNNEKIVLTVTRTSLNRLHAKCSRIRKYFRAGNIDAILRYLSQNLSIRKLNAKQRELLLKDEKTRNEAIEKHLFEVSSFWTVAKIEILVEESRRFYKYRQRTKNERDIVPAHIVFSSEVAEVLLWFEEFSLAGFFMV